MKTSQDLLDVERRIRITRSTRDRWINNPERGVATVGIFDDLLAMLEARRAKIREEIGEVVTPAYEPAPTEKVELDEDKWEEYL